MATIDATRGVLVIRIVYDGPALSGKTTSLKALALGVASQVECPEERNGRTLYFDWMEYVGGLFEGRQISCQIVSVPGQKELAHRRRLLLETADAVVCVVDTRRHELDFALSWLSDVVPYCRGEAPPIGIVLQANKRDTADAVPRTELRERVSAVAPVPIVESVATSSDGIREAFVLAVRLALDRVRALSAEGRLESRVLEEKSAEDVLRSMQRADLANERTIASNTSSVFQPNDLLCAALDLPDQDGAISDAGASNHESERLFVPDPLMPGGMIWPPVDGRALLHEVATLSIRPARTPRGDWWGSGAGWRFHSGPGALYNDVNAARHELIVWARMHTANTQHLSNGRAVILADAGGGRKRLWQLVRVEPVLRERLETALASTEPRVVSEGLVDVASQLLDARNSAAQASVTLPCTLWTVGTPRAPQPWFVGLMPEPGSEVRAELPPLALMQRELAPRLRDLRRARVDYTEILRSLMTLAEFAAPGSAARLVAEVARSID